MSKLKTPTEWWTAPAESENGNLVMVTGRPGLEAFRRDGHYVYRIEMTWTYASDNAGMPLYADSVAMEQVTEAIDRAFVRDPVAVLTGIYTGDGQRDWVFYARSLHIFRRKLNEILAAFDMLPLSFRAEDDPEWEAYDEMCQCEVQSSGD